MLHVKVADAEVRRRLWEVSERLTGLVPGAEPAAAAAAAAAPAEGESPATANP